MTETEECRKCGQVVLVMCQKMTGFCCAACEETYEE